MNKDTAAFWQRLIIVMALGAILGVLMNIQDAVRDIRDEQRLPPTENAVHQESK